MVPEFHQKIFNQNLCSRRSSQCIRLNSDKPQTTVFFVCWCFTQKWADSVTFLIGRFPLNRQIFKLDHEWRILIKEELNLNIFHPPFCPTAAEILHEPPSFLPPHPPPICLTPIFLQFKGLGFTKITKFSSRGMSQIQSRHLKMNSTKNARSNSKWPAWSQIGQIVCGQIVLYMTVHLNLLWPSSLSYHHEV